eukprot:TRINITY_DN68911_c0_g1_i1.p1 TRINITY_DN68911_c0_g1~~TRINITY_DN68911_c0_g1_i1.p1  ORF type:complete len:1187 (-),score=121.32 TRINITY_DN68911_c0_g1_i1:87-3647(-)
MAPLLFLLTFFISVYGKWQDVRHVSLKFTATDVEITDSVLKHRYVEFDVLHRSKQLSPGRPNKKDPVHVYYHDRDGNLQHTHTVSDPVFLFADWQEDGVLKGTQTKQEEGWLTVTIPHDASHIEVRRQETYKQHPDPIKRTLKTPSFQHKLRVPKEPHFTLNPKFALLQEGDTTLGAAGPAELIEDPDFTQRVGPPDKHKNFVFLSGGYTAEQKSLYLATVKNAITFLRNGQGNLLSAPWNRYVELINFYVVWQPSVESGASFPLGPDGSGGHPDNPGVEVKVSNNMDCKYGTKITRLLNCNWKAMRDLAFTTVPVNAETTTMIAFVNDVVHGGSGGWRATTLYAGEWTPCDPNKRAATGSTCVVVRADDGQGMQTVGWEPIDDNYLRVFIHEIGHADVDLADEYSYGNAEEQDVPLLNCHATDVDVPWKNWIISANSDAVLRRLGVLAPSPVCSYTNYYKPTEGLCLMDVQASNEYCAQCAEDVIRAIYRETQSLAAPRCPGEDETLVITTRNERHSIGIPARFISGPVLNPTAARLGAHLFPPANHPNLNGDVLELRVDNGPILTQWDFPPELGLPPQKGSQQDAAKQSQIAINGAELDVGDWKFTLTIEDQSEFVRGPFAEDDPLATNMTFITVFRVKVVPENDQTWGKCTGDGLRNIEATLDAAAILQDDTINTCPFGLEFSQAQVYCSICDEGKICNASYPLSPIQAEANIDAALAGVEGVMFGVGGGLILGGFIAILVIWALLARYFRNEVKNVIPFPMILKIGRVLMLGTSIIIQLIAIAMTVVGVYMYNNLSAFGKAFVIVAIIFAAFLYLLAFMGFTAAYYRSKVMLTINGIVLFLLVVVLVAMSATVFYLGNNVKSDKLKDRLRNAWINQVSQNPKSVCSFETTFQCSGFNNSCSTTTSRNSECPLKCEVTHRDNPDPCYDVFVHKIEANFKPTGAAALGVTITMFIGLIINWGMCCCIQQRKLALKLRLADKPAEWANEDEAELCKLRAVNILKNLTAQERQMMKDQFKKFDKDKSGSLSSFELRMFYKKTLDQDLSQQDVEEAIRRLDADGDGKVNFEEFVGMYSNDSHDKKQAHQLLSDARISHLSPAEREHLLREFQKMDKDASGTISTVELKLFYKKLYGQEPDPSDLDKALRAVDNDGSGNISFFEFVSMFAGKTRSGGARGKSYTKLPQ